MVNSSDDGSSEQDYLINGTPRQKIEAWLKLSAKDVHGHLKSGVCCQS
jgi:hypothetical protein